MSAKKKRTKRATRPKPVRLSRQQAWTVIADALEMHYGLCGRVNCLRNRGIISKRTRDVMHAAIRAKGDRDGWGHGAYIWACDADGDEERRIFAEEQSKVKK